MVTSPRLDLPFLAPSQAQKHVTHNEALLRLDALVQASAVSRTQTSPPPSPSEGDAYLLPANPTGDWTGRAGSLAAWQDGVWTFFAPQTGWCVWVVSEAALVVFDGANWAPAFPGIDPAVRLSVGEAADAVNRLRVASPASLFSHSGAGHQLKINKAAASDTASLVLQSGFSGRAEIGLVGDNQLVFKTSPNGATFDTALSVDPTTKTIVFPQSALSVQPIASAVVLQHDLSINDALSKPFTLLAGSSFAGVNLPHSSRPDTVWALGYNLAPGGKVNAGDVAFGFKFENFFYEQAITTRSAGVEWHFEIHDINGVVFRPIYTWFPRDGLSGSIFAHRSDLFTFRPFDKTHPFASGQDPLQISFGGVATPATTFEFKTKGKFAFSRPNNDGSALIEVMNAAATATNVISTSTLDELRFLFGGSVRAEGLGSASGTFANSTFGVASNTPAGGAPVDGGRGVYVGTFAGKHAGVYYIVDSFARGDDNIIRARTDQLGAKAGVVALVPGSSTSDAYFRVERQGQTTGTWTFGNDASDGHRFKLSRGAALGVNDVLTIDPSLNMVSTSGPMRVASFAVSALPGAASVGAGGIVFVSNESGGPTLAFSDGVDWRRVQDRQIVS